MCRNTNLPTFEPIVLFPTPLAEDRVKQFTYRASQAQSIFEVHDPFSLRRAIFPVFKRSLDGSLQGLGTAFHIDGWGTLLTADHVVDFVRDESPGHVIKPDVRTDLDPTVTPHAVALLGIGLVFGTVAIPDGAFAPALEIRSPVSEHDAPMRLLRGDTAFRIADDIASMRVLMHKDSPRSAALALARRKSRLCVGDPVLAIGYPKLRFEDLSRTGANDYLEEGMHGVFGEISAIYPFGRSEYDRMPLIEVSADWQPGMSGGPVFDREGHVVGIVSKSIPPDGPETGVGYATYLPWIRDLQMMTPTLDLENPGWRLGYGVLKKQTWALAGFFQTLPEATSKIQEATLSYQIAYGANRIGSNDFVEIRSLNPI